MLTIKTILKNGTQMLVEAKSVTAAQLSSDTSEWGNLVVYYVTPNGEHCSIDDGIVYVMNEAGSTIATYDMCMENGATV